MLSGKSILCFAPDRWGDIWRNRHQLMTLFAAQNQVLYVEPRLYLRSFVRAVITGHVPLSTFSEPRLTEIKPGLHVFHQPLYAPRCGRFPLRNLTDALRVHAMRRAMRHLGMQQPILWLFKPDMNDVPGRYGECLLVYHVVDEYLGYADVDLERARDIRQREEELLRRADLVLVTSRELLASKGGFNPNTHWVPNAVNYAAFEEAVGRGEDAPELRHVLRPRIGYVGAINDKIDTGLLLRVSRAYPQIPLVLVGPVSVTTGSGQAEIAELREQPNVHFVGSVSVDRVPLLVANCQIGLLPYRRNEWTRHIHPLKMYEYMACGLPTVATNIPSVCDEENLLYAVEDDEGFVAAITKALAENNPTLRERRRARAKENTWQHRVEEISNLINLTLSRRSQT